MKKRYLSFLIFIIYIPFIVSCQKEKETKQIKFQTEKIFVVPTAPFILTEWQQKADYLAKNYWKYYDFSDTTIVSIDASDKIIADYLNILTSVSENQIARNSIKETLQQTYATKNKYTHFLETFEKYLYNPNSPIRNEILYTTVLEFILTDSMSKLEDKERARFELKMIQKNKIGDIAADFKFKQQTGKTGTLHQLKGDLIFLMFYNPDCQACSEVVKKMKNSPVITEFLDNKKLTVFLFYPDPDLELWKKYLAKIPNTWVNSYDPEGIVKENDLYDLKAIPTIYLLDKDKRVIFKDIDLGRLEEWLWQNDGIK